MATVVVNPDRFLAEGAAVQTHQVSPAVLRRKAPGFPDHYYRARRPEIPKRKFDFNRLGRVTEQLQWTRMLIDMVSGDPR